MINRARWGTTLTFALAGLLMGVWVTRIPALAATFHLDAGQVGLAVLAWGVGALVAMQSMRAVMLRFGSHAVLRVATPLTALSLVLVAAAPNYPGLLAAVVVYGMVFGMMDIGMNSQAVTVEQAHGGSIMNGMHAGWSVGALTGGLAGAGTAALGLTFGQALVAAAAVGVPAALALGFTYLPDARGARVAGGAPRRKLPRTVYLIGALAFAAFLVEGSIADWSGLYLSGDLGSTEAVAALGYPLFEFSMIIGRLFGDRLRNRFGTRNMLVGSGAATALVLVGLILAPGPFGGLTALFVVGFAICTVIPITMSMAGTVGGAQSGASVAQVGAMGYTGLLLGPVVLGFAADHSSLRTALWIVVGVSVAIAVGSRLTRPGTVLPVAVEERELVNA
ncbi:MFS transporter [Longispora fulva]|uniref:MFS family permease n=1 Tax=Longispora fulva TaxID=619741 RepID=A0A8J7KZI0_9ACTN|nr:MFS transporter [Longispora fulva]MBG6141077.1 MFS family permease [Longispora fulva]GIG60654.1 MFS transporter [Longispora fulva]